MNVNLDNFYGIIYNSGINGELKLGEAAQVTMTDCKSMIPGTASPVISKYGGYTASVSFNNRAYSGGLRADCLVSSCRMSNSVQGYLEVFLHPDRWNVTYT